MEGLTAETCSFDGSRQTNYIQLLSLADGDSLTQPAFQNVTTYVTTVPTTPVVVRRPNNRDVPPKGELSDAVFTGITVTGSLPQSQLLLAYDLGDGRYAISGGVLSTPLTPVDLVPEVTSNASDFTDVDNSCVASSDIIPETHLPPAPSFVDTEAQLEAPICNRSSMLSVMPAPGSSAMQHIQPSVQEASSRRKRKLGRKKSSADTGSTRGGGWPKGKKRKKTHPRLNEPIAPATAYVIYSRERRPLLRIENPEFSNAELTRIIGNEWTTLSKMEKEKYFQKATQDMERYKKELTEYQRSPEYQAFEREKREERRRNGLCGGAANSIGETSAGQIHSDQQDHTAVVSATPGPETGGLYCADCDVYFFNEHNKSEHMRSQKHRRSTLGEFERYLTKTAAKSKCPSERESGPGESPSSSASFPLPDPVDVGEFIVEYVTKEKERNLELASLRETVATMNTKCEQTATAVAEHRSKHETLKREITQLKLKRVVNEQQLANLRAIPLLFETEFGLLPI